MVGGRTQILRPTYNMCHRSLRAVKGPFNCTPCSKEFKLIYNFVSHMKFVHQQETMTTTDFARKLTSHCKDDGSLPRRSVQTVLEDVKWYACKVCGKCFPTVRGVTAHEKSHSEKLLTCSLCHRSFTHHISLERHKYLFHGLRKPRVLHCKSCGKGFATKKKMDVHRCHTTNCSMPVRRPSQQTPPVTVDKNKGYFCNLCDRSFAYNANLTRHLWLSHGEDSVSKRQDAVSIATLLKRSRTKKNHKCPVCGKCLSSVNSLKRHINVIHLSEKKFVCSVCGRVFGLNNNLQRHVLTQHL